MSAYIACPYFDYQVTGRTMNSLGEERGEIDPADFDIAAIYDRYGDVMHKVAYDRLRRYGRTSESGDVVQDVVVGLISSPPKGVTNWEAYLVRSVQFKVSDRTKSAASIHDGGTLKPDDVRVADGSDIGQDVVEAIDRQQRAAVAWDCLAVLDDRERIVIWEVVALERSRKDIAAQLGVSPARITQIKNAGLDKLENEMRRREAGDD